MTNVQEANSWTDLPLTYNFLQLSCNFQRIKLVYTLNSPSIDVVIVLKKLSFQKTRKKLF